MMMFRGSEACFETLVLCCSTLVVATIHGYNDKTAFILSLIILIVNHNW